MFSPTRAVTLGLSPRGRNCGGFNIASFGRTVSCAELLYLVLLSISFVALHLKYKLISNFIKKISYEMHQTTKNAAEIHRQFCKIFTIDKLTR